MFEIRITFGSNIKHFNIKQSCEILKKFKTINYTRVFKIGHGQIFWGLKQGQKLFSAAKGAQGGLSSKEVIGGHVVID